MDSGNGDRKSREKQDAKGYHNKKKNPHGKNPPPSELSQGGFHAGEEAKTRE